MLCLPVLADTARISQLAEITQFIFGRPLRRRAEFECDIAKQLIEECVESIATSRALIARSLELMRELADRVENSYRRRIGNAALRRGSAQSTQTCRYSAVHESANSPKS